MLSQDAIQKILGIEEVVPLSAEEMADKMNITFFPYDHSSISSNVLRFVKKLNETLVELDVNVVPYKESLTKLPLYKSLIKSFFIVIHNVVVFLKKLIRYHKDTPYIDWAVIPNIITKRQRVKPGISIIAVGESNTGNLPMDNTLSFRESSVITIVDMPSNINDTSEFHEHFNTAMQLFAYHMSNIVIAVNHDKWLVYNFNASHPVYDFDDNDFKKNILHALVPKIVAPIRPHRFKDFTLLSEYFDIHDTKHNYIVNEFVQGGKLFEETKLYPVGKKIDDLPFRNNFYRWIGKLHLDHRNGMSYGFLAWQMPTELSEVLLMKDAKKKFGDIFTNDKDYFNIGEETYVVIKVGLESYCLKVPAVWVLSQRSGSDKTHIRPNLDLIKMGLVNGKMFLQTPNGLKLDEDYKPSFDTKVILSHAVGNAIVASLLQFFESSTTFSAKLSSKGLALAHWHGYIDPSAIPNGWHAYGIDNPHVACSSPQSAIYALVGKIAVFASCRAQNKEYRGDIHIEPHHGTNITFTSIVDLASFFIKNPSASTLGNKYLRRYENITI